MEKEITIGNKTLKISQDEYPESPRTWDNMAKFICFHKRYNLGDKHDYTHGDYEGWDEMAEAIKRNEKAVIVKPLYMYDHSGLTISTSPFSCPWDSGRIGFVIVTRKAILECFGVKRITKAILERAEKNLEGEVKTYDQYLTGDVYGFQLEEDGEVIDSCSGFYGSDFKTNGILDHLDVEKELMEQFAEQL